MSVRICLVSTLLFISTFHIYVYAGDGFHGQVYSYDQLMRLAPVKRAQYLRELAEIVAQMESQQGKFEIADSGRLREMRDQVAWLLKMSEPLPGASAVEPEKAGIREPGVGDKWCQEPKPLSCQALDKPTMEELKRKFRSHKKNECITAGSFQPYRNNVPKPGNCSYTYAFPEQNSAQKISCDRGEVLCNPLLFCVGVDVEIQEQSQFMLAPLCVSIGQDMTRSCMAKFDTAIQAGKNVLDFSALKKKHRPIFNQARQAKPRTCDLGKDLANYSGLKEKYDSLRASVQGRYADLCEGDSSYQAMFCTECDIIGKRIYAMNTNGGYGGCASENTAAPKLKPEDAGPPSHSRQ